MDKKKMKILGIDLAKNQTGFVVADVSASEISVEKIGTTNTTAKENWGDQYWIIYRQMQHLKKMNPDIVVVERPFMQHGDSTMAIFGALGVVRMVFRGMDIKLVSANSIKKYVAGHGHAKKELVQEKLVEMFPDVRFRNEDESDALGVVVTYCAKEGFCNGTENI